MSDAMWTVLVVDDEPMLRSVFRRWLVAAGYKVIEAATGAEALVHLRAHGEVTVVVTDLTMPGMSGEELIEHLAAERPALPVIAISGNQDRPPRIPHDRFLAKPIARNDLLRVLEVVRQA